MYRLVRQIKHTIPYSRLFPPKRIRMSVPIAQWTTEGHARLITSWPVDAELMLCITGLPDALLQGYASQIRPSIEQIQRHFECPPLLLYFNFPTPFSVIETSPISDGDTYPFVARLDPLERTGKMFQYQRLTWSRYADEFREPHQALFAMGRGTGQLDLDVPSPDVSPTLTRLEAEIRKLVPEVKHEQVAYLRPFLNRLLAPTHRLDLGDATRDVTGLIAYKKSEAISDAILEALEGSPEIGGLVPWERLRDGSQDLLMAIEQTILGGNFFVADMTLINANVLYELALATGAGKRILRIYHEGHAKPAECHLAFDRTMKLTGYDSPDDLRELLQSLSVTPPATLAPMRRTGDPPPESKIIVLFPPDTAREDLTLVETTLKSSAFTPRLIKIQSDQDLDFSATYHPGGQFSRCGGVVPAV